ncbi:MAG: flagellar hook-length control protein FliK [Rhodocyclaceae bacterium]
MIPSDLAARLRLLAESVVHPVSPVRGIPADLPELPLGQRFTAHLESAQPDGTFRALVAGRSLTLALPGPARTGDTLELVVTARAPGLIVAEQAEGGSTRPSPPPILSRAGQLISTLLDGEAHAPQPASITRAAPLLPQPAPQAAVLAPALRQTVAESGLFYEAHQAQWIAGRYPAEALAREPQARLARPQRLAPAAVAAPTAGEILPDEPAAPETPAAGRGAAPAPGLAAELRQIVQQQLDAAATQHLVWRGELWPGQPLHWEIEAEAQSGGEGKDGGTDDNGGEAVAETWSTTLRLVLPRLGEVNAALRLAPGKVSLGVTADAAHAPLLRQAVGDLAAAFAAAGLPPPAVEIAGHASS